jgi:hypothetical protein
MASCAVCGTGVRDGATHCTTCGTATGFTPAPPDAGLPPAPVVSPPSPFEDSERWLDPAPAVSGSRTPAGPTRSRPPARAPRSKTRVVAVLVLAAVVAAVLAVVAVPRLFPSVDPQKFVGTWAYAGNSVDTVSITRQGKDFTLDFGGATGAHQTLPGVLAGKKLEIDFARLGPQGAAVKKLSERIGVDLSFTYRASDDRLLLTGSNPSQGSFTLVLQRTP